MSTRIAAVERPRVARERGDVAVDAVLGERDVVGRDVGHLPALFVDERDGEGADLACPAPSRAVPGAWAANSSDSANADIDAS